METIKIPLLNWKLGAHSAGVIMEAFTLKYFDIVGHGFYFHSFIARQIEA
jgi:hypothetical protein